MTTSPTSITPSSPRASLDRTQVKALVAAFLGWTFDGLDGYLFVMVANRFVGGLINKPPLDPETISKVAIIQCVFLIGWAVGGAVFGRIGDRLGRARTLTLTVLTYAIFTGLACFATQWWHLLIFRFVAALGIGGEWAAGSALVAETLHGRHKAWASAFLQSGYMTGCILASLTSGLMRDLDPRWVFIVGVLPAFLTVFIRRAVPEPEGWAHAARSQAMPPVSALFAPGLARTTILVTLFCSCSMVIAWAFLSFMPGLIASIPEVKSWDRARVAQFTTHVALVFFSANIAANFFATYLAKHAGHRFAFAFMMLVGGLVFWFGFASTPTTTSVYWVASAAAFFGLGYFGLYPMYIPPLFPTLVRTLGAGFCYNIGRLVSAAGVLVTGSITNDLGPARALQLVALLFIPGVLLACVLPRAKGED